MSQVPGAALQVEVAGSSALVRVSTVPGALPLVTSAWKDEHTLGDSLMVVSIGLL